MGGRVKKWIYEEFETLKFKEKRLEKRFREAMGDMSENPEKSIFLASGSRARAKAVYRLLGNEKTTAESILASHRDAVGVRTKEESVLLAVQDTMSVNYGGHKKTEGLGKNCEKTLGINTHSCVAMTADGIPVGLLSQSSSTRIDDGEEPKAKKKQSRPIEEKESYRWLETMEEAAKNAPGDASLIHICDREGDIYELYALAERTGEKFIIRAAHDRLNAEGEHIIGLLRETEAKCTTTAEIPANHATKTKGRTATLTVRYREFEVKKPATLSGDKTLAPTLKLTLISLLEENPPAGTFPVEWLLMTNLPVESPLDALKVAHYYKQRWKIERFHFVLKSGCKIEEIQQRNLNGIELVILMYSIIALHIMMFTYIARNAPKTPCDLIFSDEEWQTLFRAANETSLAPPAPPSMSDAALFVAKLGGWLGSPSDGLPGLKVIWLGLRTLFDLCYYRRWI